MYNRITTTRLLLMFAALASFAVAADDRSTGSTNELVSVSPLANVPGHSLTAVLVELAPGLTVPSHTHAGFVFVYVLEGTARSQLNHGETVEYVAGQSWVEPPGTIHSLALNPSMTETTKLLAVFVAMDGAELTHVGEKH